MVGFIILLVLFVLALGLWAAIISKTVPGNPEWPAFAAVLILGVVVFLSSWGVIVVTR